MSTQTIAVLDAEELKDGQMKEVDFPGAEGGKILLSRLGDKIHATSAFCTHYGAPLAKGVLTADGRVTCPWHGACFNVCTGDIEDAPALDAIHSFRAQINTQDGKIHVTADPGLTTKEKKSRAPVTFSEGILTSVSATVKGRKGVLIVGGGAGAIHAIESLRENGYKYAITVLTREPHVPIDRTKLSKAAPTELKDVAWRSAADLKIKYGADFRVGVTVSSISTTARTVTIDDGKETFGYDQLILATGGIPRALPIEGKDLKGVYTLRGLEDVKSILGAAKEGAKMVLVGSSFIGMELITALKDKKLASVDVVGMEEVPYERVLGKEVGRGIMQSHEQNGITFHMSTSVSKFVPSSSSPDTIGSVILKDASNTTLQADFVLLAVGVQPSTSFLSPESSPEANIPLEKDGGVVVDEYLRVKDKKGEVVEDVYAIGDIAHYVQPQTGERRRVEHWNVASNHGRAVGRTIAVLTGAAKEKLIPFEKIPIFWSVGGLRFAGLSYKWDDVHVSGEPKESKFVAYYFDGEKTVSVATMQADPLVSKASELMRLGLMPSKSEILGGLDPLTIDISTSKAGSKVKSA